ncbi:MAG: cupredoxin domain-containing protein [Dehalococcoidia bacterium]
MNKRLYLIALSVATSLAVIAGCSGDDSPSDGTPAPTSPPASISGPQPQPTPGQALDATVIEPSDGEVEIATRDTQFVGNNIAVPVRESSIIRVTNEDAAVHNLRIAGTDGLFDTEDDAVTEPTTIGEQGVGELTFAPSLPGSYTFRCDFHSTMGGQITAE